MKRKEKLDIMWKSLKGKKETKRSSIIAKVTNSPWDEEKINDNTKYWAETAMEKSKQFEVLQIRSRGRNKDLCILSEKDDLYFLEQIGRIYTFLSIKQLNPTQILRNIIIKKFILWLSSRMADEQFSVLKKAI